MPTVRSFAARAWLWGPAVLQMAVLFSVSSVPNVGELPGGAPDWLPHGAGYAILAVLLLRGFARGRRAGVNAWTILAAVTSAALYGVTDEFHQSFVPGRSAELRDLVADTTGAALGAGLAWVWARRRSVD
jgi:VanZ family protein